MELRRAARRCRAREKCREGQRGDFHSAEAIKDPRNGIGSYSAIGSGITIALDSSRRKTGHSRFGRPALSAPDLGSWPPGFFGRQRRIDGGRGGAVALVPVSRESVSPCPRLRNNFRRALAPYQKRFTRNCTFPTSYKRV
jgi:hypothetical protein